MTKTNCIILIIFAFFSIVLSSCGKTHKANNCISFTKAPVINVEGQNTGLVNQNIPLTISFNIINGCGQFVNLEQTSNGNTNTISVITKYEGCICTQVFITTQTIYNFIATQPGIYYIKFLQAENTYLTHSIVIQ